MKIEYSDCIRVLDVFMNTITCEVLRNAMQFSTNEHFYAMHTVAVWIGAHAFKHARLCKDDDCNLKSSECAGGFGLQRFMGTYKIESSDVFNFTKPGDIDNLKSYKR